MTLHCFAPVQVIEYVVLKSENAYYIPNFRCRGRACKTNLPSNTAFRGFGFPQATVVVEAYMTAVASHCDLLPEEVNAQATEENHRASQVHREPSVGSEKALSWPPPWATVGSGPCRRLKTVMWFSLFHGFKALLLEPSGPGGLAAMSRGPQQEGLRSEPTAPRPARARQGHPEVSGSGKA